VKLHASSAGTRNTFTGYGEGFVLVNGQRHDGAGGHGLIVTPERVLPWSATVFESLQESDFEAFAALGLEVLLLGTGMRQRFPHPRLTRELMQARIGIESMDLQAACRTYNILMAEERRVAAALLFG
jgi:uncharacterized protein